MADNVSSDVAQDPSWLLSPWLVFMVKRLNVVDQSCQFPARKTEDVMMHLGGHGLNLTEKFSEGCRLPHEGSAWVFTRP